jgi:hypothetical protein
MGHITDSAEEVVLDLDERVDEPSTARVEAQIGSVGEGWATTTLSIFGSSDAEEQTVWLNVNRHTFASAISGQQFSVNDDVFSNRFTRAEAEALLAVLSHELGKL